MHFPCSNNVHAQQSKFEFQSISANEWNAVSTAIGDAGRRPLPAQRATHALRGAARNLQASIGAMAPPNAGSMNKKACTVRSRRHGRQNSEECRGAASSKGQSIT
ncbi:MAG TPA: hypothetical protein VJR91_16435 [Burkholderia sp.]|nr:hypothetical protein [Burkholderia sp.]